MAKKKAEEVNVGEVVQVKVDTVDDVTAKKATEEVVEKKEETAKEEVVEKKASAKKTTAKEKAPAKKTAAKEKAPAKKTATKEEVAEEKAPAKKTSSRKKENITVMLQFAGNEYDVNSITERVKEDFGNKKAVKELNIYVKPEENMVYYVVNGDYEGKFSL